MKRRSFFQQAGIGATALVLPTAPLVNTLLSHSQKLNSVMSFELAPLPYAFAALEPHIDAKTMEIHHDKHHAAYVTNLNTAVAADVNAQGKTIEALLANISKFAPAIRNNGGGHWNHTFFWNILKPNGGAPLTETNFAINGAFGSFENFKKEFAAACMSRFGSGWAWLNVDANKNLFISSTPNQDNPLMDIAEKKGTPILGLDVWEHAYYLHYQNKRADYVTAFFNVVNWEEVNHRLKTAIGG